MNEVKDQCSLPRVGGQKGGAWPWLWMGLGLLLVAVAFLGGLQGMGLLPEQVTAGAGIVGLVLLFGGLGSRGGRGGT